MKITWVTRSFLDYRIPLYAELNRLCGGELTVIYYRDIVPERCIKKLTAVLGERAVGLSGELRLSGQKNAPVCSLRRGGIRIPWQPGLLKRIRQSQPEVMLSDGFFQWTYAPLLLRMRYHIPHVMCYEPTRHTERRAQWYRTRYRKLVSHWIDAICCNGSLCREYCREVLQLPESKLHTGNMAADTGQLAADCAAVTPEAVTAFRQARNLTGTVFLFVGRLVEVKGLSRLFEAWNAAGMAENSIVIAGEGPLREELEHFCREEKIRAYFAGQVDYDALPIFYRSADIFIIPTLQDNWSLVVPEAMACGLPVASSIYNGCHPELVKPENGWTFDPLQPESIVNCLQEISRRRAELPAMGEASRRIVAEFSPEKIAAQIYRTCLHVAEQ